MSRGTKETRRTGPEAAERLKALFAEWSREEAGDGIQRGEPPWEEVEKALNEGRPEDGKPFPDR